MVTGRLQEVAGACPDGFGSTADMHVGAGLVFARHAVDRAYRLAVNEDDAFNSNPSNLKMGTTAVAVAGYICNDGTCS